VPRGRVGHPSAPSSHLFRKLPAHILLFAVARISEQPSPRLASQPRLTSIATASDRQAADAILLFARPETGIAWQTLSVAADRKERRVTVTGRLVALEVDAVE